MAALGDCDVVGVAGINPCEGGVVCDEEIVEGWREHCALRDSAPHYSSS